jgi:L-fuculose-phosphate aldolase
MNYNRKMLRFSSATSESDLRLAIIQCGRICYDRGLTTSNDGNISTHMGDDRILITPSGISKGRMEVEDLILLDLEGQVIFSREDRKPSSETPMHLEVYKQRSDVRAVIHAHPIFATTLTVAGLEFPNDVLPEVLLTLGEVPVTRYATPSSHDDADAIRPFIQDHNALLLRQHGSLTFGRDLEEALISLERVEHVAEVFWRAQMLGNVNRIPEEARQQLIAIREKYFK